MASQKKEGNYSTNRKVVKQQKKDTVKAKETISKDDPYSSCVDKLSLMQEHRPSGDSSDA